jgi:hypothetical protein
VHLVGNLQANARYVRFCPGYRWVTSLRENSKGAWPVPQACDDKETTMQDHQAEPAAISHPDPKALDDLRRELLIASV